MQILGNFLRVSGALLLLLVVAEIGAFLSTAVFHQDVDWIPKGFPSFFPLVVIPGKEAVETGLSYFSAVMGSLLWIFESAFAVALIVTGHRIVRSDVKYRLEEKEAIDRTSRP
jgi:hypothetical protein